MKEQLLYKKIFTYTTKRAPVQISLQYLNWCVNDYRNASFGSEWNTLYFGTTCLHTHSWNTASKPQYVPCIKLMSIKTTQRISTHALPTKYRQTPPLENYRYRCIFCLSCLCFFTSFLSWSLSTYSLLSVDGYFCIYHAQWLPWTGDRPVTEVSSCINTRQSQDTDIHGSRQDSNP